MYYVFHQSWDLHGFHLITIFITIHNYYIFISKILIIMKIIISILFLLWSLHTFYQFLSQSLAQSVNLVSNFLEIPVIWKTILESTETHL